MKKLMLIFFAFVLLTGISSLKTNAQEIKLGGGIVLETDNPPFGLQFKGTYGLDMLLENLDGSVEFGIFIPKTTTYWKYTRWAIDIDGNWAFWNTGDFDFYAIGGLNITHYSAKYTGPYLDDTESGTKPGLNAGAGVNFNFSPNMSAFSEFKYIISNYDEAVFNVGVLFAL
ncbi:MAG: outer membrane beta-barrel protein [Bacteroidales bacterium]|jgi:opacity protein-like surface antigen|nr:outer membrane beta-barrel protein [Bacteroidales bacterium]